MVNSRFIVKAIFNGTSLRVPISANHPMIALHKAKKLTALKDACAFICYERNTGNLVLASIRA